MHAHRGCSFAARGPAMLPSQLETRLGAQALGASGSGAHDVRAAPWFPARRRRCKSLGDGAPPSPPRGVRQAVDMRNFTPTPAGKALDFQGDKA